MRIIAACTLAFLAASAPAFAECITVKYRDARGMSGHVQMHRDFAE